MSRIQVRKWLIAASGVATAVLSLFVAAPEAKAGDPVCGYIRVKTSSTTSTVPGIPYCDHPCAGSGVENYPGTQMGPVRIVYVICLHV